MDPVKAYIYDLLGPETTSFEVSGAEVVGKGATATINPLLHAYIRPLLAATTVDELANACTKVQTGLTHLGSYGAVNMSLEPHQAGILGPKSLIAHVDLEAAKRFTLQTGTNVGNSEGYGYIKGTTRNYFGLGEVLTVDTHMGTRTKKSHLVTASFPGVFIGLPVDWKVEGLGYMSSKIAEWGSHKEQVRGATLRCTHLRHSFGFDGVLRTLYSQNSKTLLSPILVEQAGHALKLSAFLNYTRDTRNNQFLATSGSLLRVANEIAIGDNPMAKLLVEMQKGIRINDSLSSTISARFGYLHKFGTSSHLMDRFYMGGPLDVRGFTMNRAGPHEGPISVGGNCLLTGGISLFSRIPRASEGLRFHMFGNAGSLDNTLTGLLKPRVSAGLGLVYNHPISRFELNIAMPLVAHENDGLSKGLQLGVGLSYL